MFVGIFCKKQKGQPLCKMAVLSVWIGSVVALEFAKLSQRVIFGFVERAVGGSEKRVEIRAIVAPGDTC